MKQPPADAVGDLARRARFRSEHAYTVDGRTIEPSSPGAGAPSRARGPPIVDHLARHLYREVYAPVDPESDRTRAGAGALGARFTAALADAVGDDRSWLPGWRELGRTDDGHVRAAPPEGPAFQLEPDRIRGEGEDLQVSAPRTEPATWGAWFHVRGARGLGRQEETVRLYWALASAGAVPLVDRLTDELDRARVPYHLKLLADPAGYTRADAAVTYLPADTWPSVAKTLPAVLDDVAAYLKQSVPTFTRRLEPGLGLAEDPDGEESFGEHRCRLVAEGLWQAHRDPDIDRPVAVADRFREAGLDPAAPHLDPRSRGPYRWPQTPDPPPAEVPAEERALAAAEAVGDRLVETAIRADERCTWVAARLPSSEPGGAKRSGSRRARTLSHDRYGGTSGVGLFLAHLHARVPEPRYRGTAQAAARHALTAARRDVENPGEASSIVGGYAGALGTACTLARIGDRLDDARLADEARDLAERCADAWSGEDGNDLVYGEAGAIASLLAWPGSPPVDGFATRLGEALLARAEVDERGWSWRVAANHPDNPNLCGLSHGSSGIGLALAELAAHGGDERFAEAARGAFAYERSWSEPVRGNWPRFDPEGGDEVRWPVQWCHGAAGAGLARARAAEALDDDGLREEAHRAYATTWADLRRRRGFPGQDLCLCHGLLGNAACLQAMGQRLDRPTRPAAETVGWVLDRYGPEPRQRWGSTIRYTTSTPASEHPGLMVGLAGIGLAFLRLVDPSIASPIDPLATNEPR